jgi:DNA-binding IclR family transcriptional regulator
MTLSKPIQSAHSPAIKRVAQILALLSSDDPFLSLSQAARKAKIPLSSLSQAVSDGRLHSLVMPDRRRYVAWSEVEAFVQRSRARRAPKPHVLLRLAALAQQPNAQGLPTDFATNHDRYIRDTPA